MKLKSLVLCCWLLPAVFAEVYAQSCDPWIVQIYKAYYNAAPTAEECNIKNYNNGSWNSYDELVGYIKSYKSRQSSNASQQNCDPWIVQIYQQEYNRIPTAEECNIKNYNNGSWGSYADLTSYIKGYQSRIAGAGSTVAIPAAEIKLEGDPWIFKAYQELYRRKPIAFELNVNNYNGGKWNSYVELRRYVREFQSSLKSNNISLKAVNTVKGDQLTGIFIDGQQVAVALISKNAGNVVAAGGANVVSAGGANAVSAGGANVVSAGGANVVSAGGANISVSQNMAGLSFGGRYSVQSAGSRIIPTSGSGALIIR